MNDGCRKYTIGVIEEFYCNQMTELVENEQFDDAHSIFEEFVVESEEPDEWMFIPYLEDVC